MKYGLLMVAAIGLVVLGIFMPRSEVLESQERPFVVRVPENFPTIQAAVDAAAEGATVLIGPGLYKENVTITKSLRLVGAGQEQAQIQAADEDKPIIHVWSKIPLQVYFQGFTLGDLTLSLEQVLQMHPPPGPVVPNFLPRTGLSVVGPIQTLVRRVTVGGLGAGIGILGILPGIPFEEFVYSLFQPPAILEEVRLVHNVVGLALLDAQVFILRSVIEENFGGIFGVGVVFLHHSVVRGNQQFGVNLGVDSDQRLMGHFSDNEIARNGIGVYLVAKEAGSWVEISSNRLVQNEQYAVVVQDPACPFLFNAIPVHPGAKSAPIQILGAANELQGNKEGDLCPEDYPWPPGFRKP